MIRSAAKAVAVLVHALVLATASFSPDRSDAAENHFIGNGLETQGFAPVVKLELSGLLGEKPVLCTGTFITPTHILTAAHCVCQLEKRFALRVNGTLVVNANVFVHPALGEEGCRQITWENLHFPGWKHDLAVIEVPPPASSRRLIYRVHSGWHRQETQVTLVGFGFSDIDSGPEVDLNQGRGAGIKRYGTNQIEGYLKDGRITVRGNPDTRSMAYGLIGFPDGERVAAMRGDSGGPLLIRTTIQGRQQYVIAGIASQIETIPNSLDRTSIFATIAEKSNLEFIRRFVKTYPR